MSQKPDDFRTLSLCREHHAEQHRIGEQTFAETHAIDLGQLVEEFCIFSPKAADIRRVKAERANG
jgi:hypothetical protein